jgi:uncharacterized protein (TIGR02118 family)
MPESPTMVYVTYEGTHASRFDRKYYEKSHLPMVLRAFKHYGLESAVAFYPEQQQDGTVAICELRFADPNGAETAWSSDEAQAVFSDVPQFTDLKPQRLRAVPA